MTKELGTIQLSHLEQTCYFASQRQGAHLLDVDFATDLVGVSRRHAINLLASVAQEGALHRVGRGRYAVIPRRGGQRPRLRCPTVKRRT